MTIDLLALQLLFVLSNARPEPLPAAPTATELAQELDALTYVPAPLPLANVKASPGYDGAAELFSYQESAYQKLPERYLEFRHKGHVRRVNVSDWITDAARHEGIDPLFVQTVIQHESAFDPAAISGVGARGLMQLMPETARDLGVTDLTDPEQNVRAGTHYLAQQYRHFANVHLALAAYNAGPGAVEKFGGVPPYAETMSYAQSIAVDYGQKRLLRY